MDRIFTDGACSNNGKSNAKAGFGVFFGEGDQRNVSEPVPSSYPQTNNVAELLAIEMALNILGPEQKSAIIYSDSDYSIKCLTVWVQKWRKNNWKNGSS